MQCNGGRARKGSVLPANLQASSLHQNVASLHQGACTCKDLSPACAAMKLPPHTHMLPLQVVWLNLGRRVPPAAAAHLQVQLLLSTVIKQQVALKDQGVQGRRDIQQDGCIACNTAGGKQQGRPRDLWAAFGHLCTMSHQHIKVP